MPYNTLSVTKLFESAENQEIDVVRDYLEASGDINIRDATGKTLLHADQEKSLAFCYLAKCFLNL